MKDKLLNWGYKLYVLRGDVAFAHKFEIYSGQENVPKFKLHGEPGIGPCSNAVICLSREIPRDKNYRQILYSSLNLVVYLFQKRIQCVGIIQKNLAPVVFAEMIKN